MARILIVDSCGLSPRLEQVGRAILRGQAEELRRQIEVRVSTFHLPRLMVAVRRQTPISSGTRERDPQVGKVKGIVFLQFNCHSQVRQRLARIVVAQ